MFYRRLQNQGGRAQDYSKRLVLAIQIAPTHAKACSISLLIQQKIAEQRLRDRCVLLYSDEMTATRFVEKMK